jgi:hypothetical protein
MCWGQRSACSGAAPSPCWPACLLTQCSWRLQLQWGCHPCTWPAPWRQGLPLGAQQTHSQGSVGGLALLPQPRSLDCTPFLQHTRTHTHAHAHTFPPSLSPSFPTPAARGRAAVQRQGSSSGQPTARSAAAEKAHPGCHTAAPGVPGGPAQEEGGTAAHWAAGRHRLKRGAATCCNTALQLPTPSTLLPSLGP